MIKKSPQRTRTRPQEGPIDIVSLSLFRFRSPGARAWALSQMLFARFALPKVPGIGFWKLFGSGTGEGFTPIPNTAVYGILGTWPDMASARQGLQSDVFQRYRSCAAETWTIYLTTSSARGEWDGQSPFLPNHLVPDGPVAALTRATIRPSILLKFWGRVPSISKAIGQDANVAMKIGLGEVPWVHQVTFSIWPDTRTMADFARADGPHAHAIRAVREGRWFKEELYARFHIAGEEGTWGGNSPLDRLKTKEVLAA